jgi:predicted MPP superfamily phosphohydrolase
VVIEPLLRQRVTRYDLKLRNWPNDLRLTIAALADVHACRPWMDIDRVHSIVDRTNALKPDVTVLLGDYVPACAASSVVRFHRTNGRRRWPD